jgi:hypothetical protein
VTELGRLIPPYPVELCASSACRKALSDEETDGAHLFNDQATGKLVVFCGYCAAEVELRGSVRFLRVAL